MKVGSLEVIGSINVENIKFGLREMKRGLDEAKNSAKQSFGDINRIGTAVKGIAKPLALFGTVVTGAFTTLAMMAPQVAPHLAKMQTDFFRLSNVVGEELGPVFSKFADMFEKFVNWAGGPEGRGILTTIKNVLLSIGDSAETAIGKLKNIAKSWNIKLLFDAGGEIVEKYGLEAVAGLLGWKLLGPAGASTGAGATSVLTAESGIGGAWERIVGSTLTGAGLGAITGSIIPGAGTLLGGAVGGVAGFGMSVGMELWNYFMNPTYGGLASYHSEDQYEKETTDYNNFRNSHIGGS